MKEKAAERLQADHGLHERGRADLRQILGCLQPDHAEYVNAAASGLEGFTMSQKYNEQIFEANTRLIENYSEKVDEYMAAQKEVPAALEQIKRVF